MLIFIKVSAVIAIGLAIIFFSIFNNPVRIMQKKAYRAEINPFSIVFYNKGEQNSFKISPLDDYLYSTSAKNHLIQDAKFKQNRNLINEFKTTLQMQFLNNQKLVWQIAKDQFAITYEIADLGNDKVQITRTLENLPADTKNIGQSIALCKDCLVVNENKTLVYLEADLFTPEKLQKLNSLNLTPLVATEQLPIGISKLFILGPDGNTKLEIKVAPDQAVYLDKDWNILEIKAPVSNQKNIKLSQTIMFYSK